MTDYGATDTSTTTLGTNQFPANAVFVPGDTKLTVVQGGPKGTDVNGKTYTPVAEYVPDGNDVAQGQATMANSRPVVIASNQTDLPVKGDFAEQSGLSAAALNADLVASTDVSAYKWLSLQLTPTAYVGTLSFQWSNDNANFYPLMLYRPDTASQTNAVTAITSVSSLGYYGPIGFRYLRVRMTAYTSGTANATLELYTVPPPVQF